MLSNFPTVHPHAIHCSFALSVLFYIHLAHLSMKFTSACPTTPNCLVSTLSTRLTSPHSTVHLPHHSMLSSAYLSQHAMPSRVHLSHFSIQSRANCPTTLRGPAVPLFHHVQYPPSPTLYADQRQPVPPPRSPRRAVHCPTIPPPMSTSTSITNCPVSPVSTSLRSVSVILSAVCRVR